MGESMADDESVDASWAGRLRSQPQAEPHPSSGPSSPAAGQKEVLLCFKNAQFMLQTYL